MFDPGYFKINVEYSFDEAKMNQEHSAALNSDVDSGICYEKDSAIESAIAMQVRDPRA